MAIVAMLAVAGCAPVATSSIVVDALEECPASVRTCVPLIASYTDKDPAIIRIIDDETRVTDVRRVIVGRLNGGTPQPIELRFRSPEAALMDDDYGTFATIGTDTILTTHGPLELPAGALSLIVEKSYLLIDLTGDRFRWIPGPELFWTPRWPPQSATELWPSFDGRGDPVWINNMGCFRLPISGAFTALPLASCKPAVLQTLSDDDASRIKARVAALGLDFDGLTFNIHRVEGMPFYLRFPGELH